MSRPPKPRTLVEKIAAAFSAVDKLPRAGTNKTRGYDYTRASDVLEAVRGELFKRSILICPSEGEPTYIAIAQSNGGEPITECRLQVTYTFRDPLEKLEPMVIHGVGRDVEDKALYKAQTGAQKALLKRFGLLAEDVDDPEFDQSASETLDNFEPRKIPRKEMPLAAYQIDNIREAIAQTDKSDAALSEAVASIGHAAELAQVKQRYFKELLKWASDGKGTITAPKPQAVADQGTLPLRAARPAPIEMKIGNQTVQFEPKDKAYSV